MSKISIHNLVLLAVVQPGFEDLAATEIAEKFPDLAAQLSESQRKTWFIRGGVQLNVPPKVVPELHYRLKTPTSIRERLYEFKCRDFPKLYNKIQSLRWREHLVGDAFELSVTAEKSRLGNEKRIVEAVTEGIRRYFSKQPPKKPTLPYAHKIYVRFANDVCTISRDLTGAPLYQRGYKQMSAIAPIRENLAAALFFALWRSSGVGSISGREGFDILIDPMCGSGTFLLEAHLFDQDLRRAIASPEGVRDFAFLHDARWATDEALKPASVRGAVADTSEVRCRPTQFVGFDQNARAVKSARQSLANLHVKNPDAWTFFKCDLFSPEFSKLLASVVGDEKSASGKARSVAFIINPPYGERLSLPMPPAKYYPHLLARLAESASSNVKLFGVVIPQSFSHHVPKKCGQFRCVQAIEFENGGIAVQFHIYRRSSAEA